MSIRSIAPLLPVVLAFTASLSAVPAAAQPTSILPEPQPMWDAESARELLAFGRGVGAEGLDPADYLLADLARTLANGTPEQVDAAAARSFALLARDLADGRVPYDQRPDWYNSHTPLTPEATARMMALSLAAHRVTAQLASLSPANADYLALKQALAATPPSDAARVAALRVNMERWRWLPRSFGTRYLWVNVPEYEVRLIDNGQVTARHKVIVGKPATPTPALRATLQAVQFNPYWSVPSSIVTESVGALVRGRPAAARARGFEWSGDGGGLHVRQKPGPNNALGQTKFLMPNPHAIYLHDTPSKALFANEKRAYSHGCIRVQYPEKLAEAVLGGSWDADHISAAIAAKDTVNAPVDPQIAVSIVYLTAVRTPDGGVRLLPDLYGRDAPVAAALGDPQAMPAARPKAKGEPKDCLCN